MLESLWDYTHTKLGCITYLICFKLIPFSPMFPNDGSVSEEVKFQCWGMVISGSIF